LQHSLEEFGESQQARYAAALARGLALIQDHPAIGRERNDLRPGGRSLQIEQHVIVYDIRGMTVRVLRIVHHRRDLRRALNSKT
jgi:toxin ParE1/3/4